MAGNEIKLTLRVNDDGTLGIVGKKARQAAAGVDQLDKSTKKANKSRNSYQKVEKGVAGATSNSTKAFSKQAQAIGGGLVPAYAVLAANVFAITAAFGVLQRSAALTQLKEGLVAVGNAAGQNLPYVASQLKEITGAAVSTEQAMRSTALAMSAGFSTTQLQELTKVAKGASLALGRDMGDAMDRLVRGTAKLEPEILDELGIMVRLDDAVTDYAIANNKAVDSITQFERRQAFLNATIEQGTKKFDEIAEVVDANPYDKLAASFSDLSHELIELVSKGLIPLIDLLSSSPVALSGALAAFGGGVVRSILPSIQAVSDGQKQLAQEAIMASKRAGKAVSSEYVNLSKRINKIEYSTPSLKKLKKQFQDGTVSAASLQDILKKGEAAEARRTATLQQGSKFMAKASQQSIENKQKELQAVKQLNAATRELIANEEKRLGISAKGQALRGKSRMARRESAGLQAIDSAGLLGGLGIAAKQSKRQFAEIGKASGALNVVSTGFKVATSSAKLFGTALLRLIPVVGQLMFVGSLIAPLFSDMFTKSKVKEKTEEVIESFDSLITIAQRLSKVLADEAATAFDKYFASLKVRIGVLDQLESGLIAVNAASQESIQADLTRTTKELQEAEKNLQRLRATSTSSMDATSLIIFQGYLNDAEKEVARLSSNLSSIAGRAELLDVANSAALLRAQIALIESTSLKNTMGKDLIGLRTILDDVLEGVIKTPQELTNAVASLSKPAKEMASGIAGTGDAFKLLRDEIQTLGQKSPTEFSKITAALKTFSVEANAAGKEAQAGLADVAKGSGKEYERLSAVLKKLKKPIFAITNSAGPIPDTFAAAAKAMKENEETMVTSAANAKIFTEEAKKLKEVSKENAFLMGKQLEAEKKALDAKIAEKQARVENLRIAGLTSEQSEEVRKLDREILALKKEQIEPAVKLVRIEEARLRGLKRVSDALMKEKDLQKQILDARDKLARRDLQISRAGAGTGLTAQDELDIFNKTKAERKKLEQEVFEQKLRAIDIEYALLDVKFDLEEFRLLNTLKAQGASEKETADARLLFDRARAATEQGRDLALQLAGIKVGVEVKPAELQRDAEGAIVAPTVGTTETDAKEAQLTLNALKEAQAAALKDINQEAERAALLGRVALNLAKQEAAAALNVANKRAVVDELKKKENKSAGDLIALAQAELELEKAITDEISKRIAIRDNEVATVERLAGEQAGAFASFIASMQTASEVGGVFEKGITFTSEGLKALGEAFTPIFEEFGKLGPDGEVAQAVTQGAFAITEAFTRAAENISQAFDDVSTRVFNATGQIDSGWKDMNLEEKASVANAAFQAAGAVVNQLGNIMAAASEARVQGVAREIEAEKKRDGQSAQSLARIASLEKKKEAMARKAFEQNKKMQMAQAAINTATAVTGILASESIKSFPVAVALAAAVGAMGAAQLAMIASTSYQGGGSVSKPSGGAPSAVSMGSRSNVVDVSRRASAGELAYMRGARGTGTSATDFRPAFTGAKYRAAGGETAGYVVGEQGPELFVPETPGRIVPNDDIAQAAPVNVTFSVQAIDANSFNDALATQRGNIISMIREAANSSGEGFLETVDTNALQMER